MKKLFLTASFSQVSKYLPEFANEPLAGKRITFIPTANVPQSNHSYVEAAKADLTELGLIVDVLDVSSASAFDIQRKLSDNDYIYVSGGNTFFLLQELRLSGADIRIIEQVNKGKLYIGESAGSVITSPDIAYLSAMDSMKKAPLLVDTQGLNLVDFYTLPHYTNAPFEAEAQQIIDNYADKINLQPISNTQYITVLDGVITRS